MTHVTTCSREVLVRGFNKSARQTEGRWGSGLSGRATERKPDALRSVSQPGSSAGVGRCRRPGSLRA